MKKPSYDDDQESRHVGFADEHIYCRRARSDEEFVMNHFNEHASRCRDCADPYATHLAGKSLCDKGHLLAQDVARYIYSKGGMAFSMLDRASLKQRVQVEIPPRCDRVRGLLRAVDRGLRVEKPGPSKSYDKNYYVPARPKRQHQPDDYVAGGPVKAPRRAREAEDRYAESRRPEYDSAQGRRRMPERRNSLPASYKTSGPAKRMDPVDNITRKPYYDDQPFYFYRPSRKGPEMRIPRSESPAREIYRRLVPDDYYNSKYISPRSSRYDYPESRRSSRYGPSEGHYSGRSSPDYYESSRRSPPEHYRSSRHHSPESYRSSGRSSPESYRSSRRSSPESYRSSRQTSPESYGSSRKGSYDDYGSVRQDSEDDYRPSSRRYPESRLSSNRLWSAKRLYRDLFA